MSKITLINKCGTFSLSYEATELLNVQNKDLVNFHIQDGEVYIYKCLSSGFRLRVVSGSSNLCFNNIDCYNKISGLLAKIALDSKSVTVRIIEEPVELDGVFKEGYLLDLNLNY